MNQNVELFYRRVITLKLLWGNFMFLGSAGSWIIQNSKTVSTDILWWLRRNFAYLSLYESGTISKKLSLLITSTVTSMFIDTLTDKPQQKEAATSDHNDTELKVQASSLSLSPSYTITEFEWFWMFDKRKDPSLSPCVRSMLLWWKSVVCPWRTEAGPRSDWAEPLCSWSCWAGGSRMFCWKLLCWTRPKG